MGRRNAFLLGATVASLIASSPASAQPAPDLDELTAAGLGFSGFSADGLVEFIELRSHPWFVASQFHPEFTSTPRDGHPLFTGFVRAAREYRAALQPGRATA